MILLAKFGFVHFYKFTCTSPPKPRRMSEFRRRNSFRQNLIGGSGLLFPCSRMVYKKIICMPFIFYGVPFIAHLLPLLLNLLLSTVYDPKITILFIPHLGLKLISNPNPSGKQSIFITGCHSSKFV